MPAMATERNTPSTARRQNSKRTNYTRNFLQGRAFLTLDFFMSHMLWIAFIIVMLLTYIGNKYECQLGLQETIALQAKLENAKTDCVEARGTYYSMILESHMKEYIDTMHVDLAAPEQPPYHIKNK